MWTENLLYVSKFIKSTCCLIYELTNRSYLVVYTERKGVGHGTLAVYPTNIRYTLGPWNINNLYPSGRALGI